MELEDYAKIGSQIQICDACKNKVKQKPDLLLNPQRFFKELCHNCKNKILNLAKKEQQRKRNV